MAIYISSRIVEKERNLIFSYKIELIDKITVKTDGSVELKSLFDCIMYKMNGIYATHAYIICITNSNSGCVTTTLIRTICKALGVRFAIQLSIEPLQSTIRT